MSSCSLACGSGVIFISGEALEDLEAFVSAACS